MPWAADVLKGHSTFAKHAFLELWTTSFPNLLLPQPIPLPHITLVVLVQKQLQYAFLNPKPCNPYNPEPLLDHDGPFRARPPSQSHELPRPPKPHTARGESCGCNNDSNNNNITIIIVIIKGVVTVTIMTMTSSSNSAFIRIIVIVHILIITCGVTMSM